MRRLRKRVRMLATITGKSFQECGIYLYSLRISGKDQHQFISNLLMSLGDHAGKTIIKLETLAPVCCERCGALVSMVTGACIHTNRCGHVNTHLPGAIIPGGAEKI